MATFELKEVSVSTGDKLIVDGASFSFGSGEVHMLMGPNGSGKSSLLNAIFGHPKYMLVSGSIMLDGEDITELPTEKKARRGLFLSLQHLPEIAGVTMTNFLHRAYKEQRGSDITPINFFTMMTERAREAGIDPELLKKHVNSGLSGGEKKQSELLQLLALEPKFAFLDEIDSGVDVDAMKKVYSGINALKEKGVGFLLVTHNTNILAHISPNHVSVMRKGKIVARGGKELAEKIAQSGFDAIG